MPLEKTRGRKLPKLMTYHVFSHIDGDELLSVMDSKGMTDHFRDNRGPPGPRLDHLAVSGFVHLLNLSEEMVINKRTLVNRARHNSIYLNNIIIFVEQ